MPINRRELGIGWQNLKNQAMQGADSIKDKLTVLEITQDVIQKYHLKMPGNLSEQKLSDQIQKLMARIPLWDKALDYTSVTENPRKILETAVLVAAIRLDAKKEYCFLATPMEAAIRSEGIAVVAAKLLQETDRFKSIKHTLREAVDIYNTKPNFQTEFWCSKTQEKLDSPNAKLLSLIEPQRTPTISRDTHTLSKQNELSL